MPPWPMRRRIWKSPSVRPVKSGPGPALPPGVGSGMKPPKFLNVGDVVTLSIEGLGEQRQEIVAA